MFKILTKSLPKSLDGDIEQYMHDLETYKIGLRRIIAHALQCRQYKKRYNWLV